MRGRIRMLDKMEEGFSRLTGSGVVARNEIRGCSQDAVSAIEEQLGLGLPPTYIRFLELAGQESGRFLAGSSFHCTEVLSLQAEARRLLAECEVEFELPDRAVVFLVHQGYQFLYFIADGSPDPAVYHFLEGEAESTRPFESFSEWFSACVDDEVEALKALE